MNLAVRMQCPHGFKSNSTEMNLSNNFTSLMAQSKEFACSAGEPGSIPRSGRLPGEGNGSPLNIFAWRIPWTEEPQGRKESDTTE